jgi:2-keto-4-pentenoate hydratase/2-oxohepta-3-ene-1,7-dioic acid hydratase in catechol pathway
MRLCTFEVKSRFGSGRRLGMETAAGRILDLNLAYTLALAESEHQPRAHDLADVLVPPDMLEFLRNEQSGRDALNEALVYLGPRAEDPDLTGPDGGQLAYEQEKVRLLAPLPRPNSIRDCLVFEEHLKNSMGGQAIPPAWYEIPVYYKGNPDTVAGPGEDVVWPSYTQVLDYELEFAAVVGRQGVNISREEAWDYIVGYTIFNDVSARDIQMKEMSCLLGPAKG